MLLPLAVNTRGKVCHVLLEIDVQIERLELIISDPLSDVTNHFISTSYDDFITQTFTINALSIEDREIIPTIFTKIQDIEENLTLKSNKRAEIFQLNDDMTNIVMKNGQFKYTLPLSKASTDVELKIMKRINRTISEYASFKSQQCNQLSIELTNKNQIITKLAVAYDHALDPLSTRMSAEECVGVDCVRNLFINKEILRSMISTAQQVKSKGIQIPYTGLLETIYNNDDDEDQLFWSSLKDRGSNQKTLGKKDVSSADAETDIESEGDNEEEKEGDAENPPSDSSPRLPSKRPQAKRKLQGLLRRYKKPKV